MDVLAERNRPLILLFQFPVSFKFTSKDKEGEPIRLEGDWDHIADVLDAFNDYPKNIEFRHGSWDDLWVFRGLREHQTAWVNIDEPRLGASLHGADYVTAPLAYLRLHGRNYKKWFHSKNREERYDYLYTPDELEPIAESLKQMATALRGQILACPALCEERVDMAICAIRQWICSNSQSTGRSRH